MKSCRSACPSSHARRSRERQRREERHRGGQGEAGKAAIHSVHLLRAADYGSTIIGYRNGNAVQLADVARVYDGIENDKAASWFQGDRAIYLGILKQPP